VNSITDVIDSREVLFYSWTLFLPPKL